MNCPHCKYEGEMVADYYEAVNQSIDGTLDDYDYTGVIPTTTGSTQDECIRCPSCYGEVKVFGRFRFIPVELVERVDALLTAEVASLRGERDNES